MEEIFILKYVDDNGDEDFKASITKESLIEEVAKQCKEWGWENKDITRVTSTLLTENHYIDAETMDGWTIIETPLIGKSEDISDFLKNKENLITILSDAFFNSPWFVPHTPKAMAFHAENAKEQGIDTDNWCREEKWAYILLNGGYIVIEDESDDEEENKTYNLTLENLNEGWKHLIKNHPEMYANIMAENTDFYDMDGLIQCSIFGQIIYG